LDGLDVSGHELEPESDELSAGKDDTARQQQVQMPNALMEAFNAASHDEIDGSMKPPTVRITGIMGNRASHLLSLEEIGLSVTGVAAGMRPPESESNVDETLEGSPDEDKGASTTAFDRLEAAGECMERSARVGMAALPKADFHGRTTWYNVSDDTRKIKSGQRKRVTQLAAEGKKQTRQELKAYQAKFCAQGQGPHTKNTKNTNK
jgi:hypothetical protein